MRYLMGGALAIVLSYAVLFCAGPAASDAWVEEDRIVESVGALALLAASVSFLLILIRGRREKRFGLFKQMVLVGLVLLFFFGAGEEISWGQRYLGLATPAELKRIDAQQEFNVHNLKQLSGWLDSDRLFQMFWILFGVALPVAVALSKRARAFFDRLTPLLPLWVAVLLVFNQAVAWLADAINQAQPSWYEGRYYSFNGGRIEVTESIISALLAAGSYALHRNMGTRNQAQLPTSSSANDI